MASWNNIKHSTYIIAEVGQNHNGDMGLAKKLIDVAAMPVFDYFTGETMPGVDAIKFTKRDMSEELTAEAAQKRYVSPHAFGTTYGEHREALELSVDQHKELEEYAHSKGLDFIETLCSPGCLDLLDNVEVEIIKIASRDITNIPLLEKIGELTKPVILSTGMCTMGELEAALEILSKADKEIAILHCISEYPAHYENINLRSIPELQKRFPEYTVGYSDHSIGIMVPIAAVSIGAAIIEKHITLNRNLKGSDQAGSLEPEGLWRVVRDIRNIEHALGARGTDIPEAVADTRVKLARSLAAKHDMQSGDILREEDVCMLSPGNGMTWEDRKLILGKKASCPIAGQSSLKQSDFE